MKTVILFVLIVASAISCHSQCGYRAIGGGASGIASIDTAIIGSIEARCTMCPATSCVGWDLPNNYDGHLYFYCPSGGDYSVQVTQGCDLLMLDTCGAFPPSGVAGQSFDVFFSIIGDAQVLVCGDAGDTIYINSKSTTSQQEELSVILLDLANCNMPTGIQEPEISGQYEYLDPYNMQVVQDFKPHSFYLKRKRRE